MKGFMRTFLGNTANGGGMADGEGAEGAVVYNRRLSDESFKTCLNPEEGSEFSDNTVPPLEAEGPEDCEVSTAGMDANGKLEDIDEADERSKLAKALASVSELEQAYMTLQESVYVEKHCAQCPPECAVLRCKSCSCRVQLREFGNARDIFQEVCNLKGLLLELQDGSLEGRAARLETLKKIKKLERQVAMREMEYGWREKELGKEKERANAVIVKLKHDVQQLQEHLLQVQEERMAQVAKLTKTISQTREENERLAQQVIKGVEQRNGKEVPQAPPPAPPTYSPLLGNPPLFEAAVAKVKESLSVFTKQYMHTLKRAGLSVDIVANGLQPGILHPGMTFSQPTHVKYVFEAHISSIFFDSFEDEGYNLEESATPMDPEGCFAEYQRLKSISPSEFMEGTHDEGQFGDFCRAKFFALMSDELDEAFFGPDDQHRPLVQNGCHPESRFYENFILFASSVWLLHKLANSLQLPARMFRVKSGISFEGTFMESIAAEEEKANTPGPGPTVGFMVIPGFRLGKTIFKSQVYLQWPKGR